jgi:hypothetical protein
MKHIAYLKAKNLNQHISNLGTPALNRNNVLNMSSDNVQDIMCMVRCKKMVRFGIFKIFLIKHRKKSEQL